VGVFWSCIWHGCTPAFAVADNAAAAAPQLRLLLLLLELALLPVPQLSGLPLTTTGTRILLGLGGYILEF
jgi:hypothetical protein